MKAFSTSAILAFALSANLLSMPVLASPVPAIEGVPKAEMDIEKRITHVGHATWYSQNGQVGYVSSTLAPIIEQACGHINTDSQHVIATSRYFWNLNGNQNCGQYAKITGLGQTHYGYVVSECAECADNDLDMSTSLFDLYTSLGTGTFSISWNFMPAGWTP
ncbi:hypothetical protein DL93DRAFT_2230114 [Clavulina sp. PMI_390]|nr:hypothetical protein DL93DRAFT_2230114 [Clavulina sp. PMI_390]